MIKKANMYSDAVGSPQPGAVRVYGTPPFTAAVLHGGPGVPGSAAGMARGLAGVAGVLEPLQSKNTIDALLDELDAQMTRYVQQPIALVGHSWGAWLGLLYAARCPTRVRVLVLVDSGPLEARYVPLIAQRRLQNLPPAERVLLRRTFDAMEKGQVDAALLDTLQRLTSKADAVAPIEGNASDYLSVGPEHYASVWAEAETLRRDGGLLRAARAVCCPIHIVHGACDPHPLEGVTHPLDDAGVRHAAHILPRCGHTPFQERYAREQFFDILKAIVSTQEHI